MAEGDVAPIAALQLFPAQQGPAVLGPAPVNREHPLDLSVEHQQLEAFRAFRTEHRPLEPRAGRDGVPRRR